MTQTGSVTLQINVAPVDLPHATTYFPTSCASGAGRCRRSYSRSIFTELLVAGISERVGRSGARRCAMLLDALCARAPTRAYRRGRLRDRRRWPRSQPISLPARRSPRRTRRAHRSTLTSTACTRRETISCFHLDSDLMFGGRSQTWIEEARAVLAAHPDVLACAPLPGPPTADGTLRREAGARFEHSSLAYRFETLSTPPVPYRP